MAEAPPFLLGQGHKGLPEVEQEASQTQRQQWQTVLPLSAGSGGYTWAGGSQQVLIKSSFAKCYSRQLEKPWQNLAPLSAAPLSVPLSLPHLPCPFLLFLLPFFPMSIIVPLFPLQPSAVFLKGTAGLLEPQRKYVFDYFADSLSR